MKAAPMTQKPTFPLMKQGDIQNMYHLQMPRWLFTDPRYLGLALEAKVAYTCLLNRFQLSRLNGWVNEDGAVFIIFTRRSLAEEMQVSYRKVIEAMKQLSAAGLIWEKRCGRGDANQIYLALVDHSDHCTNSAAPFVDPGHEATGGEPVPEPPEQEAASRSAGSALLGPEPQLAEPFAPISEMPDQHLQKSQNGTSGSTETALLDVPELHPNYKEIRKKDLSHIEYSPSVSGGERTGQTDAEPLKGGDGYVRMSEAEQLARILDNCELWAFGPETAKVFANAIERLFYSNQLRIGKAVLPQANVRSRLWDLDATVLQAVQAKLQRNQRDVKNSTAYVMAVIFNTICEAQSDLLVDPYLNGLNGPDG